MKKSRGLTLIELLVAMAVFIATMIAILGIYLLARNAHQKGSSQSDAYRAVFLALDRIEISLRGAQLLIPIDWESHIPIGPVTSITYMYPTMSNNRVVVDAIGTPIWSGRARIEMVPDGRVIQFDETLGTSRLLSNLGETGALSFLRTERDLLQVTARSVRLEPISRSPSSYEFTVLLRLTNQP